MKKFQFLFGMVSALALIHGPARAQVVGTYDNFDCFNDTGQETEGFEIDVEDISCDDNMEGSQICNLNRVFPSNFGGSLWVIRYGLPSISHYDYRPGSGNTPDAAHSYDAGHAGVLVTYAATWDGTKWVASQGNAVAQGAPGVAGNGTPYNAQPTITNGDSCWWYGLAAKYPTSGCDHFGISFVSGVAPGKISYHWKIPDPANPGQLINWSAEAAIPPSPTFSAAGGAVVAVAEAPENPEPQFGPAYFVKTTTIYQAAAQDPRLLLAGLQKVNVKAIKLKKRISYGVLQQPPAGQAGEKEDVENDNLPVNEKQATKQYEYWQFAGNRDAETGEANCDTAYKSATDALNGTNPITKGDSCSIAGNYWILDAVSNAPVYVKSNAGQYVGAHINAVQIQ